MLDLNLLLDKKRLQGDPLADETIFKILGDWESAEAPQSKKAELVHQLIRYIRELRCNDDLIHLPNSSNYDPSLIKNLSDFFSVARELPEWADIKKIERAEKIFQDHGILACLLFFCASLPEVYLIPDISGVLNVTGQLENATEQRIRATATMILSVLLPGGQTSKDGIGVVLTLRARLIHALIRYLILRGDPALLKTDINPEGLERVEPLALGGPPKGMFEALTSAGWDFQNKGLPCNQEEMAYTLLTFNYVFIRSMRRLGLKLSSADEAAYLHAWNVTGHFMGLDFDLLKFDFDSAERIFEKIQARAGQSIIDSKISRSNLGEALMTPIENSIPVKRLKPFARLITEFLTSRRTVEGLGILHKVTSKHRTVFNFTLKNALRADSLAPKLRQDLSLIRFTIRVAGYQLLSKVLIDPKKPLDLPDRQVVQVKKMLSEWSQDPRAPKWLNSIEDLFTIRGDWKL